MPLNPPPQKLPLQILNGNIDMLGFFNDLKKSVYQLWQRSGGKDGVPNFEVTDSPTVNPGWADSATTNMNAPDGYLKVRVGGQDAVIPYWNT